MACIASTPMPPMDMQEAWNILDQEGYIPVSCTFEAFTACTILNQVASLLHTAYQILLNDKTLLEHHLECFEVATLQLESTHTQASEILHCLKDGVTEAPGTLGPEGSQTGIMGCLSYAAVLAMAAAPHSSAIWVATLQDCQVPIKLVNPSSLEPNSVGNLSPCELVGKANFTLDSIVDEDHSCPDGAKIIAAY
ncbi:hypothetical protein BDQ17DRAFT_1483875 [Cyathus striatus]|nr:hypothetical protein BDQ17DRAFT_1483875 [Cyathus striatus]